MKHLFRALCLLMLLVTAAAMMPAQKTRVVFFGDSITQMGVNPEGYITQLGELLRQKGLAEQYELIGAGIGGNKVYDLYLRLEDDVLAKNPDIVVIWVGVNDVWHKSMFGTGTDPDKFQRFYEAIIKKLEAKGIRTVLVTPAAIGERIDFSNQQDGDLNLYSSFIRALAAKHAAPLVDLRKVFLDYNLKNNLTNKESGILTTDRVHLNKAGNTLVAEQMLATLTALKK
jgi:lysophospholipase L1-like esterase